MRAYLIKCECEYSFGLTGQQFDDLNEGSMKSLVCPCCAHILFPVSKATRVPSIHNIEKEGADPGWSKTVDFSKEIEAMNKKK